MGYNKVCQSVYNRDSRGEEREKGIENVFEEIMAEKFPNLKKGNRYPGTGSKEDPKQNKCGTIKKTELPKQS